MLTRIICCTLFVVCLVQSFPSQYLAWSGRPRGYEEHLAANLEADVSRHKNIPEYVHDLLQLYYLRLAQEAMDNLFRSFNLDTTSDMRMKPTTVEGHHSPDLRNTPVHPEEVAGIRQELHETNLPAVTIADQELVAGMLDPSSLQNQPAAQESPSRQTYDASQGPVATPAPTAEGILDDRQNPPEETREPTSVFAPPAAGSSVSKDTTRQAAENVSTQPSITPVQVSGEHKDGPASATQTPQGQHVSTPAVTTTKQASENLSIPVLVTGTGASVGMAQNATLSADGVSQPSDLTKETMNQTTGKETEKSQEEKEASTAAEVQVEKTAASAHVPTSSSLPEHQTTLNQSVQTQKVSVSSQGLSSAPSVGTTTSHPPKESVKPSGEMQVAEASKDIVAATTGLEQKPATTVAQTAVLSTVNESAQVSKGQEVNATAH